MRLWPILLLIPLSGCLGEFLTGELADPVPAPDFRMKDTDGQWWNLTELEGRVVMLDFMGTWCGPCQRGVPMLRDLQAAYPDMVMLSVSSTDGEGDLETFQQQYNADWPFIADDGRVVRAYLEAGAGSGRMIWPSYAIIDQSGTLRFYNQAETLPSTFTAALDDVTVRQGPAVEGTTWGWMFLAFAVGALGWHSPFLLKHTVAREKRRPAGSIAFGFGLYTLLGLAAAYASRPLSGRVVAVAPFLIAAAVIGLIYWRMKGTEQVQAHGKHIDAEGWRHTSAFWGATLWYMLPIWGAVLHSAMLRTSSQETLLITAGLALGVAAAELAIRNDAWRERLRGMDERVGQLGGVAMLMAALWNALLYLR